jgi:putative DNA primase/helicase
MDLIRVLRNEGQTIFPVISALIHTPTLRHDGSILQTPGFDESTGLLFEPQGAAFLPVPEQPTKADAEAALNVLLYPLREFPFEGRKGEASASRSVALAFILLAPVRQSFLFAPGTSFDAPTSRTGKGKLVNFTHMIAYGHRAVVDNWTTDEVENEKMLGAILLKGVGALAIDNIERPLGGGLISKILTEEKISVRILGKSELPNTEPCLLVSFTGNNSKFKKDITARLLRCRLDAGLENPEEREFDFDPLQYAKAHRPELVQAVLTILRAYIVHCQNGGARPECSPFGDYVEWSRFIREPLLWLGQPDPVATNKEVKDEDPVVGSGLRWTCKLAG